MLDLFLRNGPCHKAYIASRDPVVAQVLMTVRDQVWRLVSDSGTSYSRLFYPIWSQIQAVEGGFVPIESCLRIRQRLETTYV